MKLYNTVLHHIYLQGYSNRTFPRWLRKLIARTELHRAWLSGYDGCFEQDGVRYGPTNPYNGALPSGGADVPLAEYLSSE